MSFCINGTVEELVNETILASISKSVAFELLSRVADLSVTV
jgi:hypothetical protein